MTETANPKLKGSTTGAGLTIERVFSTPGVHPYAELTWERAARPHLSRVRPEQCRVGAESVDPQDDGEGRPDRTDERADGAEWVRGLPAAAEHPAHDSMMRAAGVEGN